MTLDVPKHPPIAWPSAERVGEHRRFHDVPVRNTLLAAVPGRTFKEMLPHLGTIDVTRSTALFSDDGAVPYVHFPESAVLSLVNVLDHGGVKETGTIGNEGMAGLSVFLNDPISPIRAFVAMAGVTRRMDARIFHRLSAADGPFHRVMLQYLELSQAQAAKSSTCAAAHGLEARCAGWLLMTRRRVNAHEFIVSDEMLASTLGARRQGVTLVMRSLHDRRVIRSVDDHVSIIDAATLERESCDCYASLRRAYARALPAVA